MTQRDGGRVSIWEPAMSETPHTTTVGINTRTAGLRFQVQAEDCVAIAAQLMAVAEEMQGIQLPYNFDTQNTSIILLFLLCLFLLMPDEPFTDTEKQP